MDVDEASVLDETFHLHNIKTSCGSLEVANDDYRKMFTDKLSLEILLNNGQLFLK
jgi:hypothetical protein